MARAFLKLELRVWNSNREGSRMIRSLSAVLGVLILCSGCGAVQRPTASYRSMSISDISARGFTLNVDVDIANPNSVAIPLTAIDYSLALAGSKVIDRAKVGAANRSIPAKGSSAVTLPIPVTFENLLGVEEGIRKGNGE